MDANGDCQENPSPLDAAVVVPGTLLKYMDDTSRASYFVAMPFAVTPFGGLPLTNVCLTYPDLVVK